MDIECDQSMHDVISLMLSNITENIPIIQEVGPPPMEENLTETEKYIDAVFTDAKVINFKKEIINEIENSINNLRKYVNYYAMLIIMIKVINEILKYGNRHISLIS